MKNHADTIRLVEIGESIGADNDRSARQLRRKLDEHEVFMLNIMASPGAGKTSLLLATLSALEKNGRGRQRCAVIEADMDSQVDADKIAESGTIAVQVRTGGFCHLDSSMVDKAVASLDLPSLDLIFLENVGNLICPAQFDTGAHSNVMILSLPEGDDKPLKYPLMFQKCEALVVNKLDYAPLADFDYEALKKRVGRLNPEMKIFFLSCKTGEGVDAWVEWLRKRIRP